MTLISPIPNHIEVRSCVGRLLLMLEVKRMECRTESELYDSTCVASISLQIQIALRLTRVSGAFYLCCKPRGGNVVPSLNRMEVESYANDLNRIHTIPNFRNTDPRK